MILFHPQSGNCHFAYLEVFDRHWGLNYGVTKQMSVDSHRWSTSKWTPDNPSPVLQGECGERGGGGMTATGRMMNGVAQTGVL
jgi:hypothetical protein